MKLKGILSSKGRREAYERNNSRTVPTPEGTALRGHTPTPREDGALICSGCTGVYSPAAFASHLAGHGMTDAREGVFITGRFDPWLTRSDPTYQQSAQDAADAERRAALIDAYWAERKRLKPRIAEGVERWITD